MGWMTKLRFQTGAVISLFATESPDQLWGPYNPYSMGTVALSSG